MTEPIPTREPAPTGPARALDMVRARFPRTPDDDGAGLREHAEHLAALRARVDLSALRGRESAVTFDPRSGRP